MSVLMRRMIRRRMRPIGWALGLVLAVVLSGGCATGTQTTAEQKACCAAMGHDCAASDRSADCCVSETHSDLQLATAKTSLVAPVAVVSLLAGIPQLVQVSYDRAVQRVDPRLRDTPAYFLGSAFLV